MDFISNKDFQNQQMIKALGIESVEQLFEVIPGHLRCFRPQVDDGLSEYEGMQLMEKLAAKNTFASYESYLGAGAYEHHVPALVGAVCSKSEFLTSYTPYQAEASQGMLQAIFEFQSSICALTGLDVANASLYDGASACAEAVLMAMRHHKDRNKVIISQLLHPCYRAVVDQYLCSHDVEIKTVPCLPDGRLDGKYLTSLLDEQTAAVLVQSPNFFGIVEELKAFAESVHHQKALFIVCGNPLSYGLYACPGDVCADIAVGDCQSFGLPLQFGGPYVGYMACRQEFVRQMPGRLVGETVDAKGRRGFVLTLQAREQHIRREKATSNICTNQALAALASLVAMLWYGKEGVQKLALTNFQRACYLRSAISQLPGIRCFKQVPIFNEFLVEFGRPAKEVLAHFRQHAIEPGLEVSKFYPDWENHFLIAVTETKSKQLLDRYVQVASQLGR